MWLFSYNYKFERMYFLFSNDLDNKILSYATSILCILKIFNKNEASGFLSWILFLLLWFGQILDDTSCRLSIDSLFFTQQNIMQPDKSQRTEKRSNLQKWFSHSQEIRSCYPDSLLRYEVRSWCMDTSSHKCTWKLDKKTGELILGCSKAIYKKVQRIFATGDYAFPLHTSRRVDEGLTFNSFI